VSNESGLGRTRPTCWGKAGNIYRTKTEVGQGGGGTENKRAVKNKEEMESSAGNAGIGY